jgi:hypothetical protein
VSASILVPVAEAREFARPAAVHTQVKEVEVNAKTVRAALEKRREHNLEGFRQYAKAGVYPHNFIRTGPLQTWRDREGHLCAAATMIDKDGKHDLVNKIAEKQNNIRLLDVTEGPALDWMLTSGFTIEEIDKIQEPGFTRRQVDVTPDWTEEDARLRQVYAETDTYLVKHVAGGLDTATERLLENPALAKKLVEGKI